MDEHNFSIYNVLNNADQKDHPLAFLNPGSREKGFHVHRNLMKPLNHLKVLKEKEDIAQLLNLHNILTPKKIFDENYSILGEHQKRGVSTNSVIAHLSSQQKNYRNNPGIGEITQLLRKYATICHMEFHPTDICNLSCDGCTYRHDIAPPPAISYPFKWIKNINLLKPKSMVVIGGGEPTLYKEGENNFLKLTNEIKAIVPDISMGLITNGTYMPEGNWAINFDWMRISLDAARPET